MEICLLPCYRFLCNNSASSSTEAAHDLSNTTKRIGMLLRGLGDPLLVVYMQCYLLGVGASVIITPLDGNYARALLQDFFIVFKVAKLTSKRDYYIVVLRKEGASSYLALTHSNDLSLL